MALAAGALLALFAVGGAHAKPPQKGPAATIVGSKEKRIAPGEERTFVVSCPRGYVLTDTAIHAVTSLGGSERPDPKAAGLRVNREHVGLTTMLVDIRNSGSESLRVLVTGRCVRTKVRVRVPGGAVDARLKDNGIVKQKAVVGPAAIRGDCGQGRQVIGHDLSELSGFHPYSFLQSVIVFRRIVRWTLQRPPTLGEALDELGFSVLCTSLKARVTKSRAGKKRRRRSALAAASPQARVIVRRIRRSHKVPPHASPDEISRISAKCPRRFTSTSFGWNSPGIGPGRPAVQLRRSLYPGRRGVAIEVTNTSGATQTVGLDAVCLTIRVSP